MIQFLNFLFFSAVLKSMRNRTISLKNEDNLKRYKFKNRGARIKIYGEINNIFCFEGISRHF